MEGVGVLNLFQVSVEFRWIFSGIELCFFVVFSTVVTRFVRCGVLGEFRVIEDLNCKFRLVFVNLSFSSFVWLVVIVWDGAQLESVREFGRFLFGGFRTRVGLFSIGRLFGNFCCFDYEDVWLFFRSYRRQSFILVVVVILLKGKVF